MALMVRLSFMICRPFLLICILLIIWSVSGQRYPIDIHYTPQLEANYLHASITTVFQIHTTQPKGDLLVFLTVRFFFTIFSCIVSGSRRN